MPSRVNNSKRNIIASYVLVITQMLFQFLSRAIIVHTLGDEFLGLSSLFSSILQVLNLAELGFSASIVYFMYKPLAQNDIDTVCALLAYFRRIYRIIGGIVFGVGVLCIPFLPFLIKGDAPESINVYILYFLYLLNTSASYFLFAHKTAMLNAIQRLDLSKVAECIAVIIQYSLQLISLLFFKNYYLFVGALIIGTALTNILSAVICKKKFPQYVCQGKLDKSVTKSIIKKVKGLMICKISGVTYTSLDSIIVSSFIGLTSVAIYNNYILIYSTVSTFILQLRTSIQAGVGDSVAIESKEKNLKDMQLLQFLFSIVATWCATCLVCLYQPFMTLWMGENMLLPMRDVILISVWFMISVVSHAYYLYLAGNGLWNEMEVSYIFSTVFNLVMNIILGKFMGVTGILLASVLSNFISGSIWQCCILFKHYYNQSAKEYLLVQLKYFIIAAVIASVTYLVCWLSPIEGILGLLIKAVLCLVVPAILLLVIYHRSVYFKESKTFLGRMIKRRS